MKNVHKALAILSTGSVAFVAPSVADAQGHRGAAPTCQIVLPDGVPEGAYVTNTWPGGVVPYRFHENVTPENQQKALDAMAEIEDVSAVQFIALTDEPNWIVFRDWTGNSACVGMPPVGCFVNIISWNFRFIIVHELMHVLGMWHEQQRPDRDQYVEINFDNIQGSQSGNFVVAGQAYGPYDFDSVMHYDRNAWGIDFNWTIKVLAPYKRFWQRNIGNSSHLSNGDIWVLNFLYSGGDPLPRAFELTSPANGELVGESWTPTFSWSASEQADSYQILVDDNGAFLSPEIDATTTETTYTHGTTLAPNQYYYWTVTASNAIGTAEPAPFRTGSFFTGAAAFATLFVDDDAAPGGSGASWEEAMAGLQDALSLAEAVGGVTEIRVGQGVYTPDRGSMDRNMSFYLVDGVVVLGGYAGVGEPDPDVRDPDLYTTILSGDLQGNDGPDFTGNEENSTIVVYAVGVDATAVLDGFQISGGNANETWPENSGAGLAADEASPVIRNCVFTGSEAYFGGAAEARFESAAIFHECLFTGNRTWGLNANPNDPDLGGALDIYFASLVTITNSVFTDNLSAQGGAVDHWGGRAFYTNCLFYNNTSLVVGGAIRNYVGAIATIADCTFSDNLTVSVGGAISGDGTDATTIVNSVFWDNSPDQISAPVTVSYSDVQGGGFVGTGNIDVDPLFVDPTNGDYRLQPGSPAIDAGDNTAVPGSITTDLDGDPRFADDLATRDTGNGDCPIVDMGSYEFPTSCPWDLDCDANVGITDFLALLAAWGTDPGGPPDLDGDGDVGITDFLNLLANWGPCL